MPATRILAAALAAAVLAGCASGTQPVPPCCYDGPVVTTRLQALQARTEDGRILGFAEVFPGFTPQEGLFATLLPFNEVQRHEIIYARLQVLLPIYDANRDGRLEKPEVLVLYAREAARATGTPLAHLGGGAPVWAVSAPTADVGGLVQWARAKRGDMTPEGQALFRDLDLLGQDLRTRGSEGPDNPGDGIRIR